MVIDSSTYCVVIRENMSIRMECKLSEDESKINQKKNAIEFYSYICRRIGFPTTPSGRTGNEKGMQ